MGALSDPAVNLEDKKPRRPRIEIPDSEDPAADLAKLPTDLVKPDRTAFDAEIQRIQAQIDGDKKKADRITQELDAVKEAGARRKNSGGDEMEVVRGKIREVKSRIVATIEEKKKISAMIEAARAQKKATDEKLKAAKQSVGRFKTNDDIDSEVERIEEMMMHNTFTIKEEKAMILQIKELRASKEQVASLEKLERGMTTATASPSQIPELIEMRKAKDEIINTLKEEQDVIGKKLEILKAKREKEMANNNFSALFEERSTIRDGISEKIALIKTKRGAMKEKEDAFYNTDRLKRALLQQISKINRAKKAADRKKWLEEHGGEEGAAEEEDDDEEGEKKEKQIDWDIAEKIALCEQLTVFLEGYKPKEAKVEKVAGPVPTLDGVAAFSKQGGLAAGDDPLGLNALMITEHVSKNAKKKNKKKAKNAAKTDPRLMAAQGETVCLDMSLETVQQFASLSLPVPTNTDDCDGSLAQLLEKKAYYEEKGKAGLTLKELTAQEKAARKEARQGSKKAEKAEEEKALAEEATGKAKIVAAEEAVFQEKKAAEAEAKAAAEKAKEAARKEKEAEAPAGGTTFPGATGAPVVVDGDIDLAAMRAAAQGTKMSEAEKKARGLLYDRSAGSGVRDDSSSDEEGDEAAAFAGGDPFEGF